MSDPAGRELEGVRTLLNAAMGRDGLEQMLADTERARSLLAPASSWHPNAALLGGLAHLCSGSPDPAVRSFREADELAKGMGVAVARALALAERAIVTLAAGNLDEAAGHASTSRHVVEEGKLQGYPTSALTFAIGARIALVRGDPVRARSYAEEAAALDPGLTYTLPALAVQTDVLLATCAIGLGDLEWAQSHLAKADDVVAHRPQLGTLLTDLAAAHEEIDILRASKTGAPSLSPAEARLLPLLTTHLSFREIGAELYVSPHTVKTQAISIYRKLGVSSRGDAVRVARKIGLLAP